VAEFDAFHALIFYDEISRCGYTGVTWALYGGVAIGLAPIMHFGSKHLQDKTIRPCFRGDKVSLIQAIQYILLV